MYQAAQFSALLIQQALLNLLRNASDAMVAVNDRPRRLFLWTDVDDNHVTILAQDSGGGFAAENADRLFEWFFITKEEGTGIGLSLSHSIVEAHRGRLWVTRNEGPGSTFAFFDFLRIRASDRQRTMTDPRFACFGAEPIPKYSRGFRVDGASYISGRRYKQGFKKKNQLRG
jgi:K+-sensing histidine kinase KdpD